MNVCLYNILLYAKPKIPQQHLILYTHCVFCGVGGFTSIQMRYPKKWNQRWSERKQMETRGAGWGGGEGSGVGNAEYQLREIDESLE